jgi:hypothetical protein
MFPDTMPIDFDGLRQQLEAIEAESPQSALILYEPSEKNRPFYMALCQTYWNAPSEQRALIIEAAGGKKGVLSALLALVYEAAERLRATQDPYWVQMGLAAAAIESNRLDPRISLLAMAELYVAAEGVGIDPRPDFEAAGGGVPTNFHAFPVVRGRRIISKK